MTNLFNNIDEKNKQKLLKSFEANTLTFKKDTTILSTLKNDNIIGIILEGCVQIIKTDYNGNRTIIEDLEENDVFGSSISYLKSNEHDVITKEDTKLILIDYINILNPKETNLYYNTFLKNLLNILNEKIEEKNERIEILTKKTIRNKLLEYFKIVSKKHGSKYIYLPFNFTDLADYLAIDRSAMSRELKNLKEEGFIEIKGKRITILY